MSRQPDRTATAAMKAPPPNTSPGLFTNGAAPAPKPQVATPQKPAVDPPASNEVKCGNVNKALGICCRNEHPPDEMHQCTGGERWTTEQAAALDAPPKTLEAVPAVVIDKPSPVNGHASHAAPVVAQPVPAPAPAPPPPVVPAKPAPVQPVKPVVPPVRAAVPANGTQQGQSTMLLPGQRAKATEAKVKPYRLFLVGEPGIGKSTFGEQSDAPIFIPAETSPNIPDEICFKRPDTWEEIFEALRVLYGSKHEYKTVVLDTADAATTLATAVVLAQAKTGAGTQKGSANFIGDVGGGFGAGGSALDEQWVRLLAAFDRLVDHRGMNVIILAHSTLGKFRSPEAGQADFDIWIPSIDPKVASRIRGWSDAAVLAKKEIRTARDGKSNKGRAKAVSIGAAHMLYLQAIPTAPWIKNRFDLPASMALNFEEFSGYMHTHRTPAEIENMRGAIMGKAEKLAGQTFLNGAGVETDYLAYVTDRLQYKLTIAALQQLDSRLQSKINILFPVVDEEEETAPQ